MLRTVFKQAPKARGCASWTNADQTDRKYDHSLTHSLTPWVNRGELGDMSDNVIWFYPNFYPWFLHSTPWVAKFSHFVKVIYLKREFVWMEGGRREWMKLSQKRLMRINVHLHAPSLNYCNRCGNNVDCCNHFLGPLSINKFTPWLNPTFLECHSELQSIIPKDLSDF